MRSAPLVSRKVRQAFVLWAAPLLFIGWFFYQPLLAIFKLVLQITLADGFTANLALRVGRPLLFTFWQAGLSTLLTFVVGVPAAYVFARFDFRGKRVLRVLTTLPFILPTVVAAAGFNALLGPRGWLNLGLMFLFNLSEPPVQVLNTLGAILIAHVFYNTSVYIRVVGSAWAQFDQRLEDAARVLGASRWRALREVTLPLLAPSILAATLLVFLFDFTSFGVVLLLGGPRFATLEVEIYIQAMNLFNLPLAGLLSAIQMLCTLLLTVAHARLNGGAAQLSPRVRGSDVRKASSLGERVLVVAVIITVLVLLVSPLAALGLRSFTRMEAERGERGEVKTGLTLAYYRELFVNRRQSLFYVPPIEAVRNSLIYAAATVVISLTLGFLAAYALRLRLRINRLLDPLLMLPLGASAVTLGLGFILVFNRPPFSAQNFPLLMPIAHSLVALPFVIRTLQPALASIPTSLRSAAAVLGASPSRVWREVDMPIMARAALVGAVFSFTISLGEFGATSFLARPEYPTIPVAVFRFISQPGAMNYGQALAMSTLLLAVCALSILVMEQVRLPGVDEF